MKISKTLIAWLLIGYAIIYFVLKLFYPSVMTSPTPPPPFNFRYFETLDDNERISAIQKYLTTAYPVGSDVNIMVNDMGKAGIACGKQKYGQYLAHTRYACSCSQEYFGARYNIQWGIIFNVDDLDKIESIEAARHVTYVWNVGGSSSQCWP